MTRMLPTTAPSSSERTHASLSESTDRLLRLAQDRLQQAARNWEQRKNEYVRATEKRIEASRDRIAELKREFELANKDADNHKFEESIAHFRKAIAIYPGFVMARNNLGAQLLALGKLDEAAEELQKAIENAIMLLPETQRMALVLRRYQELSYEEIAETLELSVPAVKSLLFRARTELRARLKNYLEG